MDHILIVGTGALASLFAARLAQAGCGVVMLGTWKEGLDAIRENGIRLIDTHGKEDQFKVQATADPDDCLGTKYALVLVKAWQTKRAAEQLSGCLGEEGIAVTLQNGLGNRETLISSLGARIYPVSREQGGFCGSIRLTEELARGERGVFLPCQFS